ncbi:hypothetical protein Sulfitobl28_12150 [Sulfitobacter pontiacus]|nr:hypothetical protein Sulfitobl28_12150 [Sulfitobacter pontiacus]
MNATLFDARACALGEGPLWHPERGQLFWFDILGKTLMSRQGDKTLSWQFDECVSAAGWIDRDTLLVASETALWRFDLNGAERSLVVPLEADQPLTRSNDGRADPWGGFWIGTMGFNAERGAGAIYRYYKGALRQLFAEITISNAICFSPDRRFAYFTDTPTRQIMRVPLDATEGWPSAPPEVFVDLKKTSVTPTARLSTATAACGTRNGGPGRSPATAPMAPCCRPLMFQQRRPPVRPLAVRICGRSLSPLPRRAATGRRMGRPSSLHRTCEASGNTG